MTSYDLKLYKKVFYGSKDIAWDIACTTDTSVPSHEIVVAYATRVRETFGIVGPAPVPIGRKAIAFLLWPSDVSFSLDRKKSADEVFTANEEQCFSSFIAHRMEPVVPKLTVEWMDGSPKGAKDPAIYSAYSVARAIDSDPIMMSTLFRRVRRDKGIISANDIVSLIGGYVPLYDPTVRKHCVEPPATGKMTHFKTEILEETLYVSGES